MSLSTVDGWLFGGGYPGNGSGSTKSGILAFLSYSVPASSASSQHHWLEIDEQVDGMSCGTLRAYILPLPVSDEMLESILTATDWSGEDRSGWRHDLSWHNTPMDSPRDPTVRAYVQAVSALGLMFTPTEGMQNQPYGMRLAQAVYPLDPTDANLKALGLTGSVAGMLGESVDPNRHALVLLTPNDD
ncbi:hypothetical protein [Polaromonas sp. JS666]|uniref:hypothetical protein n=1 Tax=Polaromonas sp. (strain JS666 / ATCC BAA-500) TaxID=296591 RepID=UPI0000536E23|nr:hypothetical protein [Polaromonas sp. JS666]ABE47231.1 hypothetical protein Bpro_5376 [Polaromonas sp. JS666]